MTIAPIASALLERRAIAASPFILPSELILSRINAATITTGMDTCKGAKFSAEAIASAPKPTCDNPSPIIEKRFNTRLTPRSAAHSETRSPTTSARRRNPY